jgi:TonB family protein
MSILQRLRPHDGLIDEANYGSIVMKNLPIVAMLLAFFTVTSVRADDKPLVAPRPTKDPIASKKHCQGTGVFSMIIKKSGEVQGVMVESSTGNVFLDADVINTFLRWRFKSDTKSFITITVLFKADDDTAFYPVGNLPRPLNPKLPAVFTESITPGKLNQWFPIY